MNKVVLTGLLLVAGVGLQGAAPVLPVDGAGEAVMYHCPGTPPKKCNTVWNRAPRSKRIGKSLRQLFHRRGKVDQRPFKRVGKTQFRHSPDALGGEAWERDIDKKLDHLDVMLPPASDAHAADLRKSYRDHFSVIKQDCDRIKDFMSTRQEKDSLIGKEQAIARSYLTAVRKHYSDISELDFGGLGQDVVFDADEVANLTENVCNVKNDLEELMDEFGLLPDDYDNGLM